jgi:bisphosphoglycerate-dependent phosphoglycerate mutase
MANFKNGMKETKKQEKTVTAAQRIEMMETTTSTLKRMIEVIAEEMDKIQQAQIALAKRLEATLKVAGEDGGLNEDRVNEFVVNQQVKEYKEKVDLLISQGVMMATEKIGDNSFVVGKELTKEGEVVSPRTQASTRSLPEEVAKALFGKKVGDLVSFGDEKLAFQIDEVYDIASPKEKQVDLQNAGV